MLLPIVLPPILQMLMLPGVVFPSHARTTLIIIASSLDQFIVGKSAVGTATLLLIVLYARGILVRRWDINLLLGLSTLNRWLPPPESKIGMTYIRVQIIQ